MKVSNLSTNYFIRTWVELNDFIRRYSLFSFRNNIKIFLVCLFLYLLETENLYAFFCGFLIKYQSTFKCVNETQLTTQKCYMCNK